MENHTGGEGKRTWKAGLFLLNGRGSPLYQAAFDQHSEGSEVRGHSASFHAISLVSGSWYRLNRCWLSE